MSDMIAFDEKRIKILSDSICRGFNSEELEFFVTICKRTGLDPFTRQIYATKQYDKMLGRDVIRPQVSVDGLRTIAERSEKYEGQTKTEWCGLDGKWVDVWLKKEYPAAARVGVLKKGHREPTYAVATWASYVQKNKAGGVGYMWEKMPDLMLGKCAESLALRKAFPNDLSGLYSAEEMSQNESAPIIETKEIAQKATPQKTLSPKPQNKTDEGEPIRPEDFVMVIGEHSGQILRDVPTSSLKGFIKWIDNQAKEGKNISSAFHDCKLMSERVLETRALQQ